MSAGPATNDESRRNAFATHVVPEVDVLLRVAQTLAARPADAEDLVQDTLLRAFGAIGSFDGSHPRAWLLTIMRNAQINRTRRRRPQLLDDPDAAMGHLDNAEDAWTGPEAVVVDAAFDAVVAEGLDALPDRLRRVVELVDVDGLRYAEAAEVLGVPVGTVMSRLHRARVRLRERLASAGLAPRRGGRSTCASSRGRFSWLTPPVPSCSACCSPKSGLIQAPGCLDPELRSTQSGMATTTIRLAVPRRKRNNEDQPPVFVDVVTFDKQAEAVADFLAKGRRVAVSGRLEYREWQSQQDGSFHSKHEVMADEIEFLDPKDKAPANGSAEPTYAAGEEPF